MNTSKPIFGFNKNQIVYCYIQKPEEPKMGFWDEESGHPWRLWVITIRNGDFAFDFDTEEKCLEIMDKFGLVLIDINK
jgi:hypothetical protein